MDMAPMGASPLESLADLLPSYTASVFLECMLFGAYAVTFFMGAWSLLHMSYMGRPSKRDLIILGVNATMFALALSVVLSVVVTQYGTLERVSDGLYKASNMTSHLGAARFCIYVTQTLICDTFMIYRAFVIWERQWKIIALPLILLILDAISGYLSTTPKGDNLTMMILFPCASFLTNSLSTALIMWRVLAGGGANTAQVARFTLYRRVITAIVQSAAVYSVASITLLVTVSVSPDSAYATCLTMFPPFIGLIFSLVVLRLARRSAASDAPSAADSRPLWYERERERGRGPALLPITAEGARASHCFQAPAIHLPPLAAYGGGDAQNPGARMLVIEKGSDDGCEGYNMEESPRFSGAVRDTSAERSSSAGSFERRDSKHEST